MDNETVFASSQPFSDLSLQDQNAILFAKLDQVQTQVQAIHAFIVTLDDAISNHPMASMLFGK